MDIKTLKRTRASQKSKLTIFKSFLEPLILNKTLNKLQLHELTSRLNKIDLLYNDFDTTQTEIENLTEIPDCEFGEREAFEASYFSAVATAQDMLSRNSERHNEESETGSVAGATAGGPNVKLPTLHLPTFCGRYQDWLEYHDTFKSLIHNNTSITNIHKFHYLRASLKDSAAIVIQSLDFSSENYKVAWELLCSRYNNRRLLINNHIQALFNIEPIIRESPKLLRNMIDTINKNLRCLKTLELSVEHWDILLIHMVSNKLDNYSIREWETYRNTLQDIPTLEQFHTFLKNRADYLETMEETHKTRRHSDITHVRPKTFIVNQTPITKHLPLCPVCQNKHTIYQCLKFKTMPIEARIDKINKLNLCKNCLRSGHTDKNCRLGPCRICSQRHNSMIHIPTQPSQSTPTDCVVLPTTTPQKPQNSIAEVPQTNNVTLSATHNTQDYVFLSTVIINVTDNNGEVHQVRALLDNGSTSSFVTDSLFKKLNIPSYSTAITVRGLNNQLSKITKRCEVTISSLTNSGYTTEVNCFVVPQITQLIPATKINTNSLNIPSHIQLADPGFNNPSEVQMLLGADIFWNILSNNHINLGKHMPTLVETTLGWLVSGTIQNNNHSSNTLRTYNTVHCHFLNSMELEEKLNKFFEYESVSTAQQPYTNGESECETIFTQTTTRHPDDNKFVVTIPLKESIQCLGDSRNQALIRFHSLERKFKRNPSYKQKYTEFIDEYIALGHMTENTNPHEDECSYFLPHHGVEREGSLTTKLRTVFDASAATTSGKSFNDIQHIGPVIQDDLIAILIRFRQHRFVVTSDIEKMYRQIWVNESQRNLQQIFWRSDLDQPIKQYKLNTITYGTASAPYLATRCLTELGKNCSRVTVGETILKDMYYDDLITGNDNEQILIETCKGVIQELEGAHFHLRKWHSNSTHILNEVVGESNNDKLLNLSSEEYSKTLGLLWSCKQDLLLFSSTHNNTQKHNTNKRTILSIIAQIFDPLGLINPCMLQAKLILQALWAKNISWDENLPHDLEILWNNFIKYLPDLATITIPRRVVCECFSRVEIHAFSDASIKAYSACVYLRSVSEDGSVSVHLLLAKSRVAPLKQKLTVPRLELCGSVLAIELVKKARQSLRLKIDKELFWCDSTIVLGWIKSSKLKLKQYVHNRVREIRANSDITKWNYVPTGLNPADIGSRGVNAAQLKDSSLWWEGPPFLHNNDVLFPRQPHLASVELPEVKVETNLLLDDPIETNFIYKYSSFVKLQRVVIYIKRFIHNCKNSSKLTGPLRASEYKNANLILCRIVQIHVFFKQYTLLSRDNKLPPKDKLLHLNPFIDSNGIIRVGGRLSNSNYSYDLKHPILLHSSHHITNLLVEYYHKILLHGGPQLLLATLRQKYWVVGGRNLTRKVTRNCMSCCRFAAKSFQPIMGNLPSQRLHAEFPFTNTAADYAGPILIANRKGRGCKMVKAYICVFVCLAVRAVHLELVTNLSSQAFIAALNRFISRRGKPSTIYSDNGTNFVGAANELSKFLKTNCDALTAYSSENEINFQFYPAYSPHFNGLAESSVKSIKHHLKRVTAMANLDYEEMYTLLVQIEATLNSRPLSPISSDPSDLTPLTPAHFLIGRTHMALPTTQVEERNICSLTRYKRIQALSNHFWKRYCRECISEQQRRNKWRVDGSQPGLGQMVLIKNERLPPNRWPIGRVTAVYPGSDGVVRVADVRTSSGTLRRGFNRLCPLPPLEQHNVPRGAAC